MPAQPLPDVYTFQCYAGPDAGKSIILTPHLRLMLGRGSQASYQLADPYLAPQHLLIQFDGAVLHFQTVDHQQVGQNGGPVTTGQVAAQGELQLGSSRWRLFSPAPPAGTPEAAADSNGRFSEQYRRFSNLVGVDQLDAEFSLKSIFSRIGEKRSDQDVEMAFTVGTRDTTPPLDRIAASWPQPWLFGRIGLAALVIFWGLYLGFAQFGNPIVIPGLLFVGAFVVPLACLVFFWEMNAPQNVSLYQTIKLLFTGGIVSILISLFFFSNTEFLSSWLGASSAGLVEESGKLLTVLVLMRNKRQYPWILNGLLFGAAVGTGFAAFESAGYAFTVLTDNQSMDAALANIVVRGILAPFGHIIWTAITTAAVWRLKGFGPFRWELLKEASFVRLGLLVMVLHMLWNASFTLPLLPSFFGIQTKHLILGAIGWSVVLPLIQEGLKQIRQAQQKEYQA